MSVTSHQQIQILHVDDEPEFADLAGTFLEREDDRFTVETATSADEGLERINDRPPDCVVSDYDMPGQNGIDFLEAVRERHPNLPFILYTGKGTEAVASEAITAGVTDYLQKETGTDQYTVLANRIKNSVTQSRASQQIERRQERHERHREALIELLTDDAVTTGDFETAVSRITETAAEVLNVPRVNVWLVNDDGSERTLSRVDHYVRGSGTHSDGMELVIQEYPAYFEALETHRAIDATDAREDPRTMELVDYLDANDIGALLDATLRSGGETIGVLCHDHVGGPREWTDEEIDFASDMADIIHRALRNRKQNEREQMQAVLAKLYQVGTEKDLTFEQKIERVLAIGCEYLDLPFGFLSRIKQDTQEIVHAVGDHTLLQPDETAPVEQSYCRKTIQSDDLVGMQDARAELGDDDPAYERFELGCYIGTKVMVGEHLYGTFCFAAPHDRAREFTAGEQEVIKLLGQWAGYELERQRFEERLQGLHGIAQRLLVAETTTDVAEITIEMGVDLFDLPVSAFWEYDAGEDVLRPVAETDDAVRIVGEAPTFERGDALLWESFDSGEIRNYEDLAEQSGAYNPETPLRSEIHIPCGSHGIITSSATEPRAFNEIDIESVRLLGALVTEAITAVKREERLVERGGALQRQNESLEEFAGIVSHDLRSPLGVAEGHLELAEETSGSEHLTKASNAIERSQALIDDLLTLAREGQNIDETEPVDLAEVIESSWHTAETRHATVDAGGLEVIEADRSRLQQLVENLYRNAVEHGGDDVRVSVGAMNNGFYVADTGSGIPESDHDEIFEAGYSTNENGTGFGLRIVKQIADAHGWEISVTESEQGGARFEVTGVEFADR